MLSISAKTVPHKKQAYPTVGNYFDKGVTTFFEISAMDNNDYEAAVFLHEFAEQHLCKKAGIKIEDIDAFDIAYEKAREAGTKAPCGCDIQDEPGNDVHCVYNKQHVFATKLEKMFIEELGEDWSKYDNAVSNL